MSYVKLILALIALALVHPLTASADTLPTRDTPEGMQCYEGPAGGRILDGGITGVTSGSTTFRAGVARMHGYFDPTPTLLGIVHNKKGNITILVFRATLQAVPVTGLAVGIYDPDGNSRFAVMFDGSDAFARSIKPMLNKVAEINHAALERARPTRRSSGSGSGIDFAAYEAASRHVSLTTQEFPDGTVSIGVADGYTPATMSAGSFVANGDDGSYIKISVPVFPLDPRGSQYQTTLRAGPSALHYYGAPPYVEYVDDPIEAWKNVLTYAAQSTNAADPSPHVTQSKVLDLGSGLAARVLSGTMTLNGGQYAFLGQLITTPPGSTGSWMLQITMLAAPIDNVASDMPKMLAMFRSEKVNMNAITAVNNATLKANLAAINAWGESMRVQSTNSYNAFEAQQQSQFEHSMANQEAAQDSIDRQATGFIHTINGTTVLQDNSTGGHGTVDSDLASALQQSDPEDFQVISVKDYIKGVDY